MGLIPTSEETAIEMAKLGAGDFSFRNPFGWKLTMLTEKPQHAFHVAVNCYYYADAVRYHREK